MTARRFDWDWFVCGGCTPTETDEDLEEKVRSVKTGTVHKYYPEWWKGYEWKRYTDDRGITRYNLVPKRYHGKTPQTEREQIRESYNEEHKE